MLVFPIFFLLKTIFSIAHGYYKLLLGIMSPYIWANMKTGRELDGNDEKNSVTIMSCKIL